MDNEKMNGTELKDKELEQVSGGGGIFGDSFKYKCTNPNCSYLKNNNKPFTLNHMGGSIPNCYHCGNAMVHV